MPLLLRQVKDHLPGGLLRTLDPQKDQLLEDVPKDNVSGERVFGFYDQNVRDKPNMRPMARESCSIFTHGNTDEWLRSFTYREQVKRIEACRKMVPILNKK